MSRRTHLLALTSVLAAVAVFAAFVPFGRRQMAIRREIHDVLRTADRGFQGFTDDGGRLRDLARHPGRDLRFQADALLEALEARAAHGKGRDGDDLSAVLASVARED